MSEEKKASKPRHKARREYKDLMKIAEACHLVQGVGMKRITKASGKDIFDEIQSDGEYSDTEKIAMQHIRENYIFTDKGQDLLAVSLRNWALERGRKTQADNRAAAKAEDEAKAKSKEEAKAKAKEAKAKAKAKAKEEKAQEKKEGKAVATSKVGEDTVDRRLVMMALRFVGENLTTAREHLSDEEDDSSVGGKQCITKDDVQALVDYVYADGEYSKLEKDTMKWIRKNIGMSKAAREEWSNAKKAAEKAAKK